MTTRAIAPIATLPVFFKLGQRRVLVAGGTQPAVWKAELLAAAGAAVTVLTSDPCRAMLDLAADLPEHIRLERRDWTPADFEGVALAVGAFAYAESGAAFRAAAHTLGVPVNVIDVPLLCDFQFGTIVERSPLVIGISTDGAAPVLGQAIRARVEALLPAAMCAWMQAAKTWRVPLQAMGLGFKARRRFWEAFASFALEGEDRTPTEEDRRSCEAAALDVERARIGRILLVGTGQGTADGLTLRAVKALQSADLLFYEPEVSPQVLRLGRREAVRRSTGSETVSAAIEAARQGSTVAWAGPGNPATCRAWKPRRETLRASGLSVEWVAGLPCAACGAGISCRDPQ